MPPKLSTRASRSRPPRSARTSAWPGIPGSLTRDRGSRSHGTATATQLALSGHCRDNARRLGPPALIVIDGLGRQAPSRSSPSAICRPTCAIAPALSPPRAEHLEHLPGAAAHRRMDGCRAEARSHDPGAPPDFADLLAEPRRRRSAGTTRAAQRLVAADVLVAAAPADLADAIAFRPRPRRQPAAHMPPTPAPMITAVSWFRHPPFMIAAATWRSCASSATLHRRSRDGPNLDAARSLRHRRRKVAARGG